MLRLAVGVALVKVAEAHGQMNVSHLCPPLPLSAEPLPSLRLPRSPSRGAVCARTPSRPLTPASLWQTPASWQDHYSEHAMRCGKNCGLNPDPAFRKDVRAPH